MVGFAHPDLIGGGSGELEAPRFVRPGCSISSQRSEIEQLSVLCSGPFGSAYTQPTKLRDSEETRPRSFTSLPEITKRQPVGSSSSFVDRMRSKPPSRCSMPSIRSIPFATHGVVEGPTLIRPAAMSR